MQTLYHRYIDVNSPLHRPYDSTITNEAPTAKSKKALYVYEECGSDERVVACRRFKDYVRASLARARARLPLLSLDRWCSSLLRSVVCSAKPSSCARLTSSKTKDSHNTSHSSSIVSCLPHHAECNTRRIAAPLISRLWVGRRCMAAVQSCAPSPHGHYPCMAARDAVQPSSSPKNR